MTHLPDHHNPRHWLYVGRLCLDVRDYLTAGRRLDAIKAVRTWLVLTGMGDSFERAVRVVQDVRENRPWIESQIGKIRGPGIR